jgi:aminomethyltransferase
MTPTSDLLRTPLFDTHVASLAKMVDFGGWNMPVQYSGIVDEHNAVRTGVGLFDVSHMGEIIIRGPESAKLVEYVSTNKAANLKVGQAHYSALLYEHGGIVDDILVHKVSDTEWFLCVNASNQDKDFEHIKANNSFDAEVDFASPRFAQIAIQGPKARATLQKLTKTDLSAVKYYWFTDGEVSGVPARIAHTGYTGEAEFGVKPCGLGARNTLRLEAKMALYGHELTASINPLEADLAWIVKFDKGDFVGRGALEKSLSQGLTRKLVGFEMSERGIGRDGYEVWVDGAAAGWVTSGGPSPTLNKNIGLCFLPIDKAEPGLPIQIQIRNAPVAAVTVPTPFYERPKA